jgi:hypothetical protein
MTTKSEAVRMDETLDFSAMSDAELGQISGGDYSPGVWHVANPAKPADWTPIGCNYPYA